MTVIAIMLVMAMVIVALPAIESLSLVAERASGPRPVFARRPLITLAGGVATAFGDISAICSIRLVFFFCATALSSGTVTGWEERGTKHADYLRDRQADLHHVKAFHDSP